MGHRLDYGIAALVGGLGMLGVLWLIRKVLSVADLSLDSGIDMLLLELALSLRLSSTRPCRKAGEVCSKCSPAGCWPW